MRNVTLFAKIKQPLRPLCFSKLAIKLHTVLDYNGCLPVHVGMSNEKPHDSTAIKELSLCQSPPVHIDG